MRRGSASRCASPAGCRPSRPGAGHPAPRDGRRERLRQARDAVLVHDAAQLAHGDAHHAHTEQGSVEQASDDPGGIGCRSLQPAHRLPAIRTLHELALRAHSGDAEVWSPHEGSARSSEILILPSGMSSFGPQGRTAKEMPRAIGFARGESVGGQRSEPASSRELVRARAGSPGRWRWACHCCRDAPAAWGRPPLMSRDAARVASRNGCAIEEF